jgi:hypothetical protein
MSKMSKQQMKFLAREAEARAIEEEAKRAEFEREMALFEEEQEQFQREHDLQFYNKPCNFDVSQLVKVEKVERKEKQQRISKKNYFDFEDDSRPKQVKLPQFCNCTNSTRCIKPHRKENYINHAIHSLCDKCPNINKPERGCRKNHRENQVQKTEPNMLFDDALNRQTLNLELLKTTFNNIYQKHYDLIRSLNNNVMDIVPDGKLSFGGACFPKDTKALNSFMKTNNVHNQVINAVVEENKKMRDRNTCLWNI